jgi:hypothetical protein
VLWGCADYAHGTAKAVTGRHGCLRPARLTIFSNRRSTPRARAAHLHRSTSNSIGVPAITLRTPDRSPLMSRASIPNAIIGSPLSLCPAIRAV